MKMECITKAIGTATAAGSITTTGGTGITTAIKTAGVTKSMNGKIGSTPGAREAKLTSYGTGPYFT